MFADALKTVREFIIRIWNSLKKQPSVDIVVDERLSDIPEEQAARIKRRLQESRERQAMDEK